MDLASNSASFINEPYFPIASDEDDIQLAAAKPSKAPKKRKYQEEVLDEIRKIRENDENNQILSLIEEGNSLSRESNELMKEANEIANKSVLIMEKNGEAFCEFLNFIKHK